VSRTSLFTGQYPHQHRVFTNTANLPNPVGAIGGWPAFRDNGNLRRSFNVNLRRAGYTTGFVGKYLNEYVPTYDGRPAVQPRGWSEFTAILRSAYDEWDFEYTTTENGALRLERFPAPPVWATDAEKDRAYADRFASRRALGFIRRHQSDEAPYFLEVATYAPHDRVGLVGRYPGDPNFPPAFRDRPGAARRHGNCGAVRCRSLTVADLPGFRDRAHDNVPVRTDGLPAPAWRAHGPRPRARDAARTLRNRARMVQTVDRLLGRILDTVDANTYVVLTSDNGYHLGPGSLGRGKGTPYDADTRVPLVVTGPGVPPGPRDDMVSNIDLAPTFEDLAGLRPAPYRSGRSIVATLRTPSRAPHDYVFFEHTWAPTLGGTDPDRWYAGSAIDVIPSYVAVRSRQSLLVRLDLDPSWEGTDVAWEFYDYRDAPFERTNSFADPAKRVEVRRLQRRLGRFLACRSILRDAPVTARCRALTRG
jgi:arylsulfatase A-like enzyme